MNLKENKHSIQTAINLFTGICTMFIQLLVSFFLSPYIVSHIGEAANGFTQLANNFVNYATLITIAFNSMAGRFIAVNYHKGDSKKVNSYYTAVIVCNLFIALLLIPLSIYVVLNLNSIIVIGDSEYSDVQVLFLCVFINYFFSLISSVYSISFYVVNKIYVQNILNLFRHISNALLLLLVFNSLPAKMYYVSMIACFLSLILIPVLIICQKKYLPKMNFIKEEFAFGTVFELLKSGIWNTVNQCGNMLMTGLDLLLSNLFIDPISMGVLAVSKTIPTAIIQLASVLNSSFAPSLTKDWAKGNDDKVLLQLRQGMKISSVILSLPIVTFCVYSVEFYNLWMPSLDSKSLAILSFLACMAFIPWAGPQILYNVFTTTNKLKVNSITYLFLGLLNFVTVWLLLKFSSLGIYAIAGVSSVLSILRNIVFTAPYTAKLLNLKWSTFYIDVIFSMMCCTVNAVIGYLVKVSLNLKGWGGLIIMVIVTVILSFIAELFLILNKDDRGKILKRTR